MPFNSTLEGTVMGVSAASQFLLGSRQLVLSASPCVPSLTGWRYKMDGRNLRFSASNVSLQSSQRRIQRITVLATRQTYVAI